MRRLVLFVVILVGLIVLAACAKAEPTATPRPPTPTPPPVATPTSAPGVTPTVAPTATSVPPTPTLSPAQIAYESTRKDFETVVKPAALKEGTLTWYTCHPVVEAVDEIKTFNKLYPGIKVEYVQDTPGALIERIKAEQKAGKFVADVYNCGGLSGYRLGLEGNAAEHLVPSAIDPSLKWTGNMTPRKAGPFYTQFAYVMGSLVINTDLVPPAKYPKSWWDFVRDPWWEGKMVMGNPHAPGYADAFLLMALDNPDLGEPFIKALSAKKPSVVRTGAAELVARGEFAVLLGNAAGAPYTTLKGAPIKDLDPPGGTWVTNFHATLVKNAPHPNATQVFIDATLSKEMQEAFSKWARIPIRADVTSAIPELSLQGKQVTVWATVEVEQRRFGLIYKWLDEKGYFK